MGTASGELLRAAKALAEQEGVAFHQHEGFVPSMSSADAAHLGRSFRTTSPLVQIVWFYFVPTYPVALGARWIEHRMGVGEY